jgi:hypothetical protein
MTRPDDDRIADRLDEDQERLVATATPLGFELRQPRKRPFEDFALKSFEAPDNVLTRLTGEVDGALVDVFEYDWVQPGAKGAVHRGRRIAVVLRHPAFEGDARCTWEQIQSLALKVFLIWPLFAFLIVTLFWLLVPIWLWQHSKGADVFARDWRVGNKEFDKRFKVHSSSSEEALRALPLATQALAVSENLQGPIEVRPGMLAVGVDGKSLDPETFERSISLAKRLDQPREAPPRDLRAAGVAARARVSRRGRPGRPGQSGR